jgi:hypothetical protein
MTRTITAQIPARKSYPARIAAYTMDDSGAWRNQYGDKVHEDDVIDVCRTALNWTTIRSEHFAMADFHA